MLTIIFHTRDCTPRRDDLINWQFFWFRVVVIKIQIGPFFYPKSDCRNDACISVIILLRKAPIWWALCLRNTSITTTSTDLRVDDARSIKHFKLIPACAMHMHAARAYASRCIPCTRVYANRACCQVYSFAQPERARVLSWNTCHVSRRWYNTDTSPKALSSRTIREHYLNVSKPSSYM